MCCAAGEACLLNNLCYKANLNVAYCGACTDKPYPLSESWGFVMMMCSFPLVSRQSNVKQRSMTDMQTSTPALATMINSLHAAPMVSLVMCAKPICSKSSGPAGTFLRQDLDGNKGRQNGSGWNWTEQRVECISNAELD